ncbi:MAG: ABC transporter substrate-binding protein [Verrucomicrobia bacterium]|nr:ABC transporter substrate-binding protein [Verrucomicrobiota bacterium]
MKTLPLIVLALAAAFQPALASTAEAENFLKQSVDRVVAIAKASPDSLTLEKKITPVLLNVISFDAMTRRAVGPGWRQFTAPEREEAVRLFTKLIIRTYSNRFTPGELPEIDYRSATSPEPGRVEVNTTTTYKGSKYGVVYRLESKEGAPWRITDIVIEGVSMIANYRTQLDTQFKSGGAAAVISSLQKSLAARNP